MTMGQHRKRPSAFKWRQRRGVKLMLISILAVGISVSATFLLAGEPPLPEVVAKFKDLSQNGNSSCSVDFMNSIASMPPMSRLKGSCCGPMALHRYSEQIAGLKQYADIAIIPPDPYDIDAGLAQKLLTSYDLPLTPSEQSAYGYAMQNSEEKGPCCCQCWRWHVLGGLGKLLVHEQGFTGEQLTKVWNLSNGCGGDEHEHG
jgi:hypothetical protein